MMVHDDDPNSGSPENAWIRKFSVPLAGAAAGPLSGLVFAAKDNIDVAGVPTTAACAAFARTPAEHAVVVRRLLDAGASVAGKTNLDQFACGLNGTRSPYGAVPNSFDTRYVSGGSSSGSAYAVATGQVDFALGTDTAGSGRVPAGLNNIVGIKPSRGLLSARGVLPAAQSIDCVSIFAPTVALAVRVLVVARCHDPADPYSRELDLADRPLPARFRFGLAARPRFFGDRLAQAEYERAVAQMKALGGVAVEVDYTPLAEAASLLYDSALVAERYAAVREFFDANEAEVIEPVRSILAQGRRYSAADFVDARVRLQALARQADALWRDIDVLVVPTAPTHCTIEAMRAEPAERNRELGEYTNFVNLLDYAAISVPSSLRPDGLPFGITLIGRSGSDMQLAELGQRYHHSTGLTLGATGRPLPPPAPLPGVVATGESGTSGPACVATVRVAVVGAHLSGMPLNAQLTERRARLLEATRTAPIYRLYALPGTVPPKPGLIRVGPGEGVAVELEVWEMPLAEYGGFVALIAAPLGIGSLSLADGSSVQGFVCEPWALDGAEDISHFGGWRAYMASRTAAA